jgi:hypothetical protein
MDLESYCLKTPKMKNNHQMEVVSSFPFARSGK